MCRLKMTWALDADDADLGELCEYEALLNPLYEGEDSTVLCQYNCERHGGDIWVDSEPGVGATFSFTLPAAAAEQ